jgi:preprotein translocase subunit SecF
LEERLNKLNNMFIVKYRKIFYSLSVLFVLCSVLAISFWGLTAGIDFKGGSSIEFVYSGDRPSIDTIKTELDKLSFNPSIVGLYSVVPVSEDGYILKLRNITEEERVSIVSAIPKNNSEIEFKKINSVGPTLGTEAKNKSIVSLILVILFIVLYLTFAFRRVSKPVASWKYGVISIIALCHDVIIPTGIFAILSHYFNGFEVDTLFVTAILVILGFSVHDTIVVFDRVRENLKNNKNTKEEKSFEEIIGMSINQTFIRSLNTSLTTLFAVLVVYLIGPVATKNFALVLLFGLSFGTYSSIFVASNLLVTVEKWQNRK